MLWELKLVSVMVIMRLTPNVLLVCGGSHRLGQNWPTQQKFTENVHSACKI